MRSDPRPLHHVSRPTALSTAPSITTRGRPPPPTAGSITSLAGEVLVGDRLHGDREVILAVLARDRPLDLATLEEVERHVEVALAVAERVDVDRPAQRARRIADQVERGRDRVEAEDRVARLRLRRLPARLRDDR